MVGDVIFSDGDFLLVNDIGIGMSDTPWEGLKVISRDTALKHVIEIRLYIVGNPPFDGTPVKYRYDPERTEVAHGMRCVTDTLLETEEYIEALKKAVQFARRVNTYLIENGWT